LIFVIVINHVRLKINEVYPVCLFEDPSRDISRNLSINQYEIYLNEISEIENP